ncbi:zinc finger MYM-type protein 1-like [Ixodes scapularis]|uniref:zinc finger MYM-type protein 1-like n=1 Tax=Ixodes scapularis TaxID=6945 RepID=UPI001A9E559E|nr:zinc finger MYM-type protein 1-like [Ixodes scapularis]XP_040063053.1 zinc finger MYM-type protein 1-like [Ixodes scapularis]
MFPWLHYVSDRDVVLCHECSVAFKERGVTIPGLELSFLQSGFSNWKNALEKFRCHEKSTYHLDAVQYQLGKTKGARVVELLTRNSMKQQQESRDALCVIVSSIRYLCRTGQALLGHTLQDGNLVDLLEERSEDVPALKTWLTRRDKWLSSDIQNEIIKIMAHKLQRDVVEEVKRSPFFGIIADGTTDVAGDEQFTLCLRWVENASLEIKEEFIGVYSPPDSKANTLFMAVKDMLVRLGLDFSSLRGHCFDGAANMSGRFSGVQKKISDIQSKSVYVHCASHSLDLALQEVGRSSRVVAEALSTVKDVSNIILTSSKRKNTYIGIVLPPCADASQERPVKASNLLPLCPTRWTVRVKSMKRFLQNYERVQATIHDLLQTPGSIGDDRRAIMRGYEKLLNKFETLFGLNMSKELFGPCEQLARVLQSPKYSATGTMQAAEALRQTMMNLRTDEGFERVWDETKNASVKLGLKQRETTTTRTVKPPTRFEQTKTPTSPVVLDAKANLRKEFFAAVDCVTSEIKSRFDQPGMELLVKLESTLVSVARGQRFNAKELKEALGVHGSDFDLDRLNAQLVLLSTVLSGTEVNVVDDVAEALTEQSPTVLNLLDQVVRLVQLLLTVPASAASGERSFSALRRVKTYLRSRMHDTDPPHASPSSACPPTKNWKAVP